MAIEVTKEGLVVAHLSATFPAVPLKFYPMPASHRFTVDFTPKSGAYPHADLRAAMAGYARDCVLAYEGDFWNKRDGAYGITVKNDGDIDASLSQRGCNLDFTGLLSVDGETVVPYADNPAYAVGLWQETLRAFRRVRPQAKLSAWGIPRKYFWQWGLRDGQIRAENDYAWAAIKDHVDMLCPEVYPPGDPNYTAEMVFRGGMRNLGEAARLGRPSLVNRAVSVLKRESLLARPILPWITLQRVDLSGPLGVEYLEAQIAAVLFSGFTRSGLWAAVKDAGELPAWKAMIDAAEAIKNEIMVRGPRYKKWSEVSL